MTPQRIEEFRRKLRDGRPVRVVGGRVTLDGPSGKPPAAAPGAERGTPPIPAQAGAPDGVYVKPHDWGAGDGSKSRMVSTDDHRLSKVERTIAPFYGSPEGERRALAEQALLDREYPGFTLDLDDDGTPFAHGVIGPTPTLRGGYHVLVELPPGYGMGVLPRAYLLAPAVRDGAPHLYNDGSLCVDHSGAFTPRSTLITFLAWVSVWLVLYEGWLETGETW